MTNPTAIIAASVSAIGSIAKGVAGESGATAQAQSLENQKVAVQIQAAQASQKRTQQLQGILSTQEEQAIGKGVSLSSPTFSSLQIQSTNQFSQDQRNADFSESARLNALQGDIDATRKAGEFSLIGGFLGIGGAIGQAATISRGFGDATPSSQSPGDQAARTDNLVNQQLPDPFSSFDDMINKQNQGIT